MIDPIRTQLARYESHLLAELALARRDARAASRRVDELNTQVAAVRDSLKARTREQLLPVRRPLPGEAVSSTRGTEA